MRVPDDLRKCVCFLGTETPDGHVKLGGSVALVSVRLDLADRFATYLITARHCVRKAYDSGDKPVLRVNAAAGGTALIDISTLTWRYADNDAIDVAVSELIGDQLYADAVLRPLDASLIATEAKAAEVQLGVGDELVCTGLFHRRQGDQRNIPIVRFGAIAAMPEEPLIDEDTGLEYDAFLAEVRSIGGLSGSPVFVRIAAGRKTSQGETTLAPQWLWLGIIRAHWTGGQLIGGGLSEPEIDVFNSGIALVTPAWEVLTILNDEDYRRERREAERELRSSEASAGERGDSN